MHRKRQINKPRPVDEIDMEAIFKQAKEEQKTHEKEFEEEQKQEGTLVSGKSKVEEAQLDSNGAGNSSMDLKPKRRSIKNGPKLAPGSTVRVVSGTFSEFEGSLKKVNRKLGKVSDAVLQVKGRQEKKTVFQV